MTNTCFSPISSTPSYTQMALSMLQGIPEANATIIKKPRETHNKNDSSIIKFNFNSKTYGLKTFPDVWMNSAGNFSKSSRIEEINNTGFVAKTITTFTLPLDFEKNQRFIIYEFAHGELLDQYLKHADPKQKKVLDQHFRKMINTFADMNIYCNFYENDDFCVTPEGKVLLLDWDVLRKVTSATPRQTIIATGLRRAAEHGLLLNSELDHQA